MSIDWTINIGHILTFAGLLAGAFGFIWSARTELQTHYSRIREDIATIVTSSQKEVQRLDKVEVRLSEIADATIAIARQDERMKGFEHRLETAEKSLEDVKGDLSVVCKPGG
jgi:hypothetical protein